MKRGASLLACLAAASLLVAAWVTASPAIPLVRGAEPRQSNEGPLPKGPSDGDLGQSAARSPEEIRHLPAALTAAFYVLLILMAVGLSFIVWHRLVLRRLERKRRLAEAIEQDAVDDDVSAGLPRALAGSAALGLHALNEGAPRNAIVRCWLVLEESLVALGLPRDPALTSEEFTTVVLGRYAVDDEPIRVLAALYLEARFSEHPLTETHRQRAVDALGAIRVDLDTASGALPAGRSSDDGETS